MKIEISKVRVAVGSQVLELTLAEARELQEQLAKLLNADDSALRQVLDALKKLPAPATPFPYPVPASPVPPMPFPSVPGTPYIPPAQPPWIVWCSSNRAGISTAVTISPLQ